MKRKNCLILMSGSILAFGTLFASCAKKVYDLGDLKFENATFTYDGTEKAVAITGNLPEGVSVTYVGNNVTDAGTYTVTAKFTGDEKYEAIPDLTATITINKATYDMSGVSYSDATFNYDGAEHELVVSGTLPQGVSVEYTNNKLTDVGTTKAVAKFTGDAKNYEAIPNMEATLTVNKVDYDLSAVNFTDATYTYDGTEKALEISGNLPAGVRVEYTTNKLTNVGSIEVTAKFYGDNNHNAIADKKATLTITKATYDMSGVTFTDTPVVYDGAEHELLVKGTLPTGVTVAYENNKLTNVGTTTATAKFTGDDNHEAIADMSATLSITPAAYDLSAVKFENATFTYDGQAHQLAVANLPTGVSVVYKSNDEDFTGATNAGEYTIKAVFTGDSNHQAIAEMSATLTINKATYDMSGVTFSNASSTYDGLAHKIEVTGTLPTGVTVTYENNTLTNAGTTTATAKFAGDANHEAIADLSATLTVNKASVAIPTAANNLVYNGNEQTGVASGDLYNVANGAATKAGTYTATVTLKDTANYAWENAQFDGSVSFAIAKATLVVTASDANTSFNADAPSFTYSVTGYVNNETDAVLTTTNAKITTDYVTGNNAGTYDIIVSGLTAENYDITYVNGTLTVGKITFSVPDYDLDVEITYDGEEHTYIIPQGFKDLLPEGITASVVEDDTLTDVDSLVYTIKFTVNGNYNAISSVDAELSIVKANYDLSSLNVTDRSVAYTGTEPTLDFGSILDVSENKVNYTAVVTYAKDGNSVTSDNLVVGTYDATVNFTTNDSNYNAITTKTFKLTVTQGTVDMSNVEVVDTLTYNGKNQTVEFKNLPSYVTVKLYDEDGKEFTGATNAGSYTLTAKFTVSDSNYAAIADEEGTLTISKATIELDENPTYSVTYNNKTLAEQDKDVNLLKTDSRITVNSYTNDTYLPGENTVKANLSVDWANYVVSVGSNTYTEDFDYTVTYLVNKVVREIATVDDLNKLETWYAADRTSNMIVGTIYKLVANIDYNGNVWKNSFTYGSDGTNDTKFNAEFDGNGYTISNFMITDATQSKVHTDGSKFYGFFGCTGTDSSIHDVTFENVNVSIEAPSTIVVAGIVAGRSHGQMENITIKNSYIEFVGKKAEAGIVAGYLCGATTVQGYSNMKDANIKNVNVEGVTYNAMTVSADARIGGFAGNISTSTVKMSDCSVTNSSIWVSSNSSKIFVSGLFGYAKASTMAYYLDVKDVELREVIINVAPNTLTFGENEYTANNAAATVDAGAVLGHFGSKGPGAEGESLYVYHTFDNIYADVDFVIKGAATVNAGGWQGYSRDNTVQTLSNIEVSSDFIFDSCTTVNYSKFIAKKDATSSVKSATNVDVSDVTFSFETATTKKYSDAYAIKGVDLGEYIFNGYDLDVEITYDGQEHTYEIPAAFLATLPEGMSASVVEDDTLTDVDSLLFTIEFTVSEDCLYTIAPEDIEVELTIVKADYDISNLDLDGMSVAYTGTNPITPSSLGNILNVNGKEMNYDVQVVYTKDGNEVAANALVVGTYTAKVTFVMDEASNYNSIPSKTFDLTVTPGTVDMSNVRISNTFTYSGEDKTVLFTNLPSFVTVKLYDADDNEFTGATNAGTYTLTAKYTVSDSNYAAIANQEITLTIQKATIELDNNPTYSVTYNNKTLAEQEADVNLLKADSRITVNSYTNDTYLPGENTVKANLSVDWANYVVSVGSNTYTENFDYTVTYLVNKVVREIASASDLSKLETWYTADRTSNMIVGTIYKLTANIDYNGEVWTNSFTYGADGTDDTRFNAEFDGNGYTISNFKITDATQSVVHSGGIKFYGFFGCTGTDSSIHDVNFDSVTVSIEAKDTIIIAGIVAGRSHGQMENINVTNSSIEYVGNKSETGIIAGYLCGATSVQGYSNMKDANIKNVNVKDVTFTAMTLSSDARVGGFAGNISTSTVKMSNCSVKNTTINVSSNSANIFVSGLLGYAKSSTMAYYLDVNNVELKEVKINVVPNTLTFGKNEYKATNASATVYAGAVLGHFGSKGPGAEGESLYVYHTFDNITADVNFVIKGAATVYAGGWQGYLRDYTVQTLGTISISSNFEFDSCTTVNYAKFIAKKDATSSVKSAEKVNVTNVTFSFVNDSATTKNYSDANAIDGVILSND